VAASPGAARAQAPVPLPVPWMGQAYCQDDCRGGFSWQGRNNCGPASLAMVAEANGLRRPADMSRARFVRYVKTLTEGRDDCGATAREELDLGAAALGLCVREHAWKTHQIEALTRRCLPVATYLDERTMPWRYNPSFYAGGDHIVVTTGFTGNRVTINDPLEARGGRRSCSPRPPDHENAVVGVAHSSYARADFDAAAYLADLGWWGKAYGDALGGCDVPPCNAAPAPAAPPGRLPFTKLTFRMSSHCPDREVRVYYVTTMTLADGAFHEQFSKSKTIENDGLFRTYTISFDGDTSRLYWQGKLRKLRIDPSQVRGCLVAFSWIGVHDAEGRTAKSWTFPAGTGGGYWWAKDTITTQPLGPIWAMHTTSNDPWIENDYVDVDLGR